MTEMLILWFTPTNRFLGKGLRWLGVKCVLNNLWLLIGKIDPPQIWWCIIFSFVFAIAAIAIHPHLITA